MKNVMRIKGMGCCMAAMSMGSLHAASEDFSNVSLNAKGEISSDLGVFRASKGHMEKNSMSADDTAGSLRITGGENKVVELELAKALQKKPLLALHFNAERWTGASPFAFQIEGKSGGKWKRVYDGNKLPLRALATKREADLGGEEFEAFRFTATTKEGSGVLLDNITVIPDGPMVVKGASAKKAQIPLLIRKSDAIALRYSIKAEGSKNVDKLKKLHVRVKGTSDLKDIESLSLYALQGGSSDLSKAKKLDTKPAKDGVSFETDYALESGENHFVVQASISNDAKLTNRVVADFVGAELEKKGKLSAGDAEVVVKSQRIGFNVAHSGDEVVRTDGTKMVCKRMRIPGMVTSKEGTLLAVYDLRWNQNGDLPGDIDVGLSRSTDGGRSWEAPRPVLDMGEWLGMPENKNGVGDPAILVDEKTGHIYITGLVAHGLSSGWYWGKSKPGMDPKDTGQVVIVKSEDDGKTWSKPRNLTPEIKDPAWQLMLQGPGAGISMRDGTLVFAFQYKVNLGSKEKPRYSARSSILYSKDHGETWKVAPGVEYPQETTEAQVVELNDGSLMLNCRISAGGRAVFTTKDLGETWTQHKTSGRGTFNMSGCMASILRYSSTKDGDKQDILLFSGPADGGKKRRTHMSIRYSLDEGETWSEPYLLDQLGGAYSCLSLIEENGRRDIGIIYEGSQSNMTFERLSLDELMQK
ncbi:exo-alpha-sialidase [Rubritalea tangerina]|uniref:exo-alpha-sialidase n=1 Tax=Rubritalea tangerina TaxID=430798 RepID=A0ABW4ZAI9_9BACT